MRLRATLVLGMSLAAGQAASAPPTITLAGRCAAATDMAMCLLQVAAIADKGQRISIDLELADRDDLIKAAGLVERPASELDALPPPYDAVVSVVAQVRALDRSGATPERAVAPLATLDGVPPGAPTLLGARLGPVKLDAYSFLLARNNHPRNAVSPALAARLLADWEGTLVAQPDAALSIYGARALAVAYGDRGDEAGLQRAVILSGQPGDRIDVLIAAGRLQQAAGAAVMLKPDDLLDQIRREAADNAELERTMALRSAAILFGYLDDEIARLRAAGDEAQARVAEKLRDQARQQALPSPPPPLGEAELRRIAEERVVTTRFAVLDAAATAQQPTAARPVADLILTSTPPRSASDEVLAKLPQLVVAASPTVASAWLDTYAESALAAPATNLSALHGLQEAWTALGRKDKLEALILVTRPLAASESRTTQDDRPFARLTWRMLIAVGRPDEGFALYPARPVDRLTNDINQGRGLAKLDAYLAEIEERQRPELMQACGEMAARRGAFDVASLCFDRWDGMVTLPILRQHMAESVLQTAGQAGAAGDVEAMRRLTRQALTMARGLDTDDQGIFTPDYLVKVAKVELRVDGRLPPPPAAQTMIGRAP